MRRENSFASNGECGLKLEGHTPVRGLVGNSFASNGECGLKPEWPNVVRAQLCNSFASNGECGLKRHAANDLPVITRIHSPAMANVD